MKNKHEEVCIKVNAYVDKGIAKVVEILNNNFEGIVTKYSCEDNRIDEKDVPRAYIMFSYKDQLSEWKKLSLLCNVIAQQIKNIPYSTVIMEWKEGLAIATLEFLSENTNDVISVLSKYKFTDQEV